MGNQQKVSIIKPDLYTVRSVGVVNDRNKNKKLYPAVNRFIHLIRKIIPKAVNQLDHQLVLAIQIVLTVEIA